MFALQIYHFDNKNNYNHDEDNICYNCSSDNNNNNDDNNNNNDDNNNDDSNNNNNNNNNNDNNNDDNNKCPDDINKIALFFNTRLNFQVDLQFNL